MSEANRYAEGYRKGYEEAQEEGKNREDAMRPSLVEDVRREVVKSEPKMGTDDEVDFWTGFYDGRYHALRGRIAPEAREDEIPPELKGKGK